MKAYMIIAESMRNRALYTKCEKPDRPKIQLPAKKNRIVRDFVTFECRSSIPLVMLLPEHVVWKVLPVFL